MGLLQAAGYRARFYPSEPRWRALACLKELSSPVRRKNGWPLAEQPNDRVVPFFDEQGIRLQRILTNRGAEYCGKPENHAYQLYLAVEDIDHSRAKASHPQTNGICERFHKTLHDAVYSLLFRRKLYRTLEELQVDLAPCPPSSGTASCAVQKPQPSPRPRPSRWPRGWSTSWSRRIINFPGPLRAIILQHPGRVGEKGFHLLLTGLVAA